MTLKTATMSDEDVDNLLTDALEGGFSAVWMGEQVQPSHWPEGARYASECLARGATLTIQEDCEGDVGTYTLTREAFERGAAARAEQCGRTLVVWLDDYDAIEADCALQLAIFGEVKWG